MNHYIWKTQLGYFSTQAMDFIDTPENEDDAIELVIARPDADTVILADKDFLRETLRFYGFTVPASLQTVTEKQTAIQEAYASQLQQLLQSITTAKILTPDADVSELTTNYTTLRDEMRNKINEVEHNG